MDKNNEYLVSCILIQDQSIRSLINTCLALQQQIDVLKRDIDILKQNSIHCEFSDN